MQREIRHPEGLPPCRHGHRSRHIHDLRAAHAGGGHFLECPCTQTMKFPEFDQALRDWQLIHPTPPSRTLAVVDDPRVLPFHAQRFGVTR